MICGVTSLRTQANLEWEHIISSRTHTHTHNISLQDPLPPDEEATLYCSFPAGVI